MYKDLNGKPLKCDWAPRVQVLLKRVWMGEAEVGGGEYKCQLSVRVRVMLSVK